MSSIYRVLEALDDVVEALAAVDLDVLDPRSRADLNDLVVSLTSNPTDTPGTTVTP